MSKVFAAYWLFGCVLTGLAWGWYSSKCPNDDMNAEGVVIAIVAWPVAVVAAVTGPKRPLVCVKATSEARS